MPWHPGITPDENASPRYADSELRRYTGTQASIISYLAPEVQVRVLEAQEDLMFGIKDVSIFKALEQAIGNGDVDVVLNPWRSGNEGLTYERVYQRVAESDIFCVVPSGNDPLEIQALERHPSLFENAFITAGIDAQGASAAFSASVGRVEEVIWAPAHQIPVRLPEGWTRFDGTGPAAAIVAAVVGKLLVEFPDATPPQLLEAMRSTAKPKVEGGPPILNASAARERLRATLQ